MTPNLFTVMKIIIFAIITLSIYSCKAQEKNSTDYFLGEIAPGEIPVLFAPAKFDHPEGYHSSLSISNDLSVIYFSPMTRHGEIHRITDFENAEG